MKILLSIFFLSLAMACTAPNENITRINIDKMNEMSSDANTVILDVRTPSEVAQGYVTGTDKFIDYNSANFEEQIMSLEKDKTYIVYCRSGNRSTKALNSMFDKGFTNLFELQGGITSVPQENITQ